jgi:precorrin-3B synthase
MIARRGACPGLADPMPTGDGLLARLAVTRAAPLDAFAALCAAARAHGNGIVEITSRGSIQVRGLTAASAPRLAAAVEVLAIADPAGGRVISNPLAGLDPAEVMDTSALADRLREVLIETGLAATLAPKVSIVIDGGGAFSLDTIPADIRLRAEATRNGVCFELTLADDNAGVRTVTRECAVKAVTELLRTVAKLGPTARGRDVAAPRAVTLRCEPDEVGPASKGDGAVMGTDRGPTSFEGRLWRPPQDDGIEGRASIEPIGTHPLRDGTLALGIGFPFGHSDAATLLNLIDETRRAGAASIRPAPGRVLLIISFARAQASGLAAAAERLGFIVTPDDPRRRVVACAGAPVCAAAEIPTRALAPAVAAAAARLDRQATIHLSGCAKGCAHPGPAALTIVGIDGKCGIVHGGTARDVPRTLVNTDDLPAYVGQLAMQEADRG